MSETGSPPKNKIERLSELARADLELVPTSPDQPAVGSEADSASEHSVKETRLTRREARRQRLEARNARYRAAAVARVREQPQPVDAPPLVSTNEQPYIQLITSLPQSGRRISWPTVFFFLLLVVAPTVIAGVYYFKYASSQYVAEFHFAVRSSASSTTQQTTGGATSMLSSLLGTSSGGESTESYMVADYITSRKAVEELQSKIGVKALYSRPSIDWWARFDSTQPMEKFVTYWRYMVGANYDQITGIATAHVRAFTAEDAHLIAVTLLQLAENLVNEISERPRKEAITFAEGEVKRAQERLKKAAADLNKFRSTESVIDPTQSAVPTNTTLVQTLRQVLTQLQTDLATLTSQHIVTTSPQAVAIQSRIKATREQLALVEAQVGSNRDGGKALANVVGSYEQLDLERQFAQNWVTSTMQVLEQARSSAITQRLYVVPYIQPSKPESSTYPNRDVGTATVFAVCFMFWTVAFLVLRSMKEHIV